MDEYTASKLHTNDHMHFCLNPSTTLQRFFENHLNPVMLVIIGVALTDNHWIALAEYSQMGTNVPGFRSFFRFLASFCVGQIS